MDATTRAHHDAIVDYLRRAVVNQAWTVDLPDRGFSAGRCFFARSSSATVAVRLGVDYAIARELSDAGITPRYLGGGFSAGLPFSIQEFVEARHPDTSWYLANALTLTSLIRRLQQLAALRRYLAPCDDQTFRSRLLGYLADVEHEYARVSQDHRAKRVMAELIAAYRVRAWAIEGCGLVPCHGDINSGNILIAAPRVYLIDWETLHLSDPLRDVAHLLWWMYTQERWASVLDQFDVRLADDSHRERFYLHVSMRALYVYLLFVNSGQERLAARFLDDARRSAAYEPPARLLIS